jgi:hypothetical protein
VLRLLPPLVITADHADEALHILRKVMTAPQRQAADPPPGQAASMHAVWGGRTPEADVLSHETLPLSYSHKGGTAP